MVVAELPVSVSSPSTVGVSVVGAEVGSGAEVGVAAGAEVVGHVFVVPPIQVVDCHDWLLVEQAPASHDSEPHAHPPVLIARPLDISVPAPAAPFDEVVDGVYEEVYPSSNVPEQVPMMEAQETPAGQQPR